MFYGNRFSTWWSGRSGAFGCDGGDCTFCGCLEKWTSSLFSAKQLSNLAVIPSIFLVFSFVLFTKHSIIAMRLVISCSIQSRCASSITLVSWVLSQLWIVDCCCNTSILILVKIWSILDLGVSWSRVGASSGGFWS
jgi:hypothetical protein